MSTIYERLDQMCRRFDEIDASLADTSRPFDQERYTALAKERARLEEPVTVYRAFKKLLAEIAANDALLADLSDPDLHALAEEEARSLRDRRKEVEEQLQLMMIPTDPNDDKDVFIEIRAGAGGDEAGIFAGDLLRMYLRYAERHGMRAQIVSASENEAGGYKEVIVSVKGGEPYRHFKYESGVHRVQRVPETEAQGRVHTSTATVAVLPEVEEVDIEIKPSDLQFDTFKSSGAGGQYVNKTESAVRITHVPTGTVVSCSEERSQLQNRERAMQMLRALLYDRKMREQQEAVGNLRRSQVGTGDRSERIR
ncbi:MAG: peptide chain release factor 1, partial [Vulcanimicrobiaceae bacterium]